MIGRLIFVLVFALTFPILVLLVFSIIPMGIIVLVLYVIRGDEEDKLVDVLFGPFTWAMELPYKITGRD